MNYACQLTEVSKQAFPDFIEFYLHFPNKYPFLLTSSSKKISKTKPLINNEQESNYDILFIDPGYWLKMDNEFRLSTSNTELDIDSNDLFLDAFDKLFLAEKNNLSSSDKKSTSAHQLPFTGGWFVFVAYELAQQIEPGLKLICEKQLLPVAYAARVKQALIYDHTLDKLFFLSESESGIDHRVAMDSVLSDVKFIQQAETVSRNSAELLSRLVEEDDMSFLSSAQTVRNYIKEGDVFQVNLSRLWKTFSQQKNHVEQACSLAQKLYQANPAPFSGLASFVSNGGRSSIISSSPERLLKVSNNKLESRPIAGTRPRSQSDHEDMRLLDELHAHPKEQAEHIMLIDLIRNDLGRVCVPGSVIVDELMTNESYAHVHHIVSNVIGTLQADTTPGDVIKALFPGGTITGCPKVRCMEIISELEQHSRGAYTGSMGYINLDGSMDLNILIRTMLLEDVTEQKHKLLSNQCNQQQLTFRAGAGLVFDSIAKKELQETRAKAKGLLKAL
ncbi:MAG: aminodeoxychorismate synthase component I [gamma proteobacterium symbiont of Bathyaustriella thionipta]|nr:aminodeoxychorismate synthase component I [gamma proteobacterium symbiont of Bathyaustriella thionipta]MCU7949121.1 aminodeoxychorismate synthase component I [gamma proteobacterium symbiont of Bathyaustriella thionipta]MCU7954432.1 aminodeoxychorismate synthase component I [gamma proteobacterium symbiont of Bathyaustriella thionipta]MCU7955706.1 aminodeoxychorismate synthase component I [gamma proteobacterium symbiont of Bathyaustriella thionipta]MCU7966200.1 aminodeoxychorismate synthase co